MTAARQQRKSLLALALMGLLLVGATAGAGVVTTERVVIDWRTGLAIAGFDPVAYFTEAKALEGQAELEFTHAGATWRFRNIGNRAAFMADPAVYMPRFGGYDPVRAASGRGVPGNPTIWLIVADQLYLFYDSQNRTAFAADSGRYLAAAERNWSKVLKTLTP